MTPLELKSKWNLSRKLLPALLGKSYRQVDKYLAPKPIEVSESLEKYCFLLDFYLENGGDLNTIMNGFEGQVTE